MAVTIPAAARDRATITKATKMMVVEMTNTTLQIFAYGGRLICPLCGCGHVAQSELLIAERGLAAYSRSLDGR